MTGSCALCGNYGTLLDSHFMPAACYPELNDPAGPIKHMIVMTRKGTFQSPEQFADSPKIDLRPEIMAKFAVYLLGNGAFLRETSLNVLVASDAQPQRAMICPIKAQETPFVRYEAHIPGMIFELFVDAGPTYDTWSLNNAPERIVLTDMVTKRVLQIADDIVPESEPKGSLKKHLR